MARVVHDPRSDEQVAHERAMGEVSDVLLNIEHAIARARKGLKRLGDSAEEHNAELALREALTSLEQARRRLQQDAYFASDDLRLV